MKYIEWNGIEWNNIFFTGHYNTITSACLSLYTGWGRKGELIINKNLLKLIDTKYSTSQFTVVINIF